MIAAAVEVIKNHNIEMFILSLFSFNKKERHHWWCLFVSQTLNIPFTKREESEKNSCSETKAVLCFQRRLPSKTSTNYTLKKSATSTNKSPNWMKIWLEGADRNIWEHLPCCLPSLEHVLKCMCTCRCRCKHIYACTSGGKRLHLSQ